MISEIYLHDTSRMDNEIETPVCTLELGSPLYFSKDGFEPSEVLFPHAAFHLPSKDKKEAYDFIDKVNTLFRTVLLWIFPLTRDTYTFLLGLDRRKTSSCLRREASSGAQKANTRSTHRSRVKEGEGFGEWSITVGVEEIRLHR